MRSDIYDAETEALEKDREEGGRNRACTRLKTPDSAREECKRTRVRYYAALIFRLFSPAEVGREVGTAVLKYRRVRFALRGSY